MYFIVPLLIFMIAVFLFPALLVFWASLHEELTGEWTLQYFVRFFTNDIYLIVLRNTIEISIVSTVVCLVLGYPLAYYLSMQPIRRRILLSMLLLLPFYTSILVKSFSLSIILGFNGIVNTAIRTFLGESFVLSLIHNRVGAVIGIVHDMLPFLVLPLMVSLVTQDKNLHKAAAIMGASRLRIFWQITFPLSLPGMLAGVLLVVVRSMGQFATPTLLGGRRDTMMAPLVDMHVSQFIDWSMAAAISVVLLAVAGIFLIALGWVRGGSFMLGRG